MSEKKEIKGIWIPLNIWLISDLSLIERVFLSQIISLDNDKRGCYASNSYFANLFGITNGRASQIITALKNKGFIKISLKFENNQVVERNIRVVNKLNTLLRKLKGVVNKLNGGIYNSKGGYLENAQVNSIDLNNIIKQFKEEDFDNIVSSEEFKNYLKSKKLQIKNLPLPEKNLIELKKQKKSEFKNKVWAIIQNMNGSSEFWTKDDFKESIKFCDYWGESKENGKLLRWEMEKTYDLKLRMNTWRSNAEKFNKGEKEKSGPETITEKLRKKYYGE